MTTTQEPLFTITPPGADLTHVLMPCMAYASGSDDD